MLEGKSKKDFRDYYIQTEGLQTKTIESQRLELLLFYAMSESKQYGVLVDWFDSVGVDIELLIDYNIHTNILKGFFYDISENNCSKTFKTRPQARQQAIKKANQIYNERTT
mgnify:CR=1 FL=1|tara:strand:+ start:489 stop:821 length:333 start_codon:yes stop_codon:yes gene_type:complete